MPPVGLAGLLRTISRQRGVIRSSRASGRVDRKAGIGVDDLDAGPAEHEDRHLHGDLAAGHDHHLARVDRHAQALGQVRADRFAQLGYAGGRRVAVMAVLERPDRRLDDVGGGLEVRLADAEVDDIAALRGQGGSPVEYLEGPLVAQPGDIRSDVRRDNGQGAEIPGTLRSLRSRAPSLRAGGEGGKSCPLARLRA
jgi:hypothetical protein